MSDDNAYQGAADPSAADTHYNTLLFLIHQELAKLRTSIPVKIVKAPYDKDGNTIEPGTAGPIGFIDVKPMVNQLDGQDNPIEHGTVYRLSYHRYQGANGAFISDPAVNDIGHMVINDRDTSVVRKTNDVANPGSRRKHDLADGIFYGSPQAGAPDQYFSWTTTGFRVLDKNGNTIVGGPTGVTINGCLINKDGDVITKKGTDLDTHKHTEVTTGGDLTGPPA